MVSQELADKSWSKEGLSTDHALGHGQSAQIFEPKARYIEAAFHSFAQENDVEFHFQYLSGILPAHPDRNKDYENRVWGYGDPSDGEIKKIELSVRHILATLDHDGPFVGIAGFSSGAAMAAIIASHLEKRSMFNDQPWIVCYCSPLLFIGEEQHNNSRNQN
jgi:hypothetical protein